MARSKNPVVKALRSVVRTLRGKKKPAPPAYAHAPADTVIRDFAEFSGLSIREVEERMNRFQALCRTEWDALPPAAFTEKARAFYANSQSYVFDLLNINTSKAAVIAKLETFQPGLIDTIRSHPGRDFLEFGGGTGVFCEVVAGLGKRVTYLDIAGLPMQFATWRFEKYKIPVTLYQSAPGRHDLPGTFDIVFTDAVIEHLPPPDQEKIARALAGALRPGGLLIFIVDLGEDDGFPMHAEVDIRRLHALLAESGLSCQSGHGRFCSLWTRP